MIEIQPSTSTSKLQNTTDKPTPQSPSGMYIPPPPIFAYLFLDACHFCALENEKTLVFSQPVNTAAEQSGKFHIIVFQN